MPQPLQHRRGATLPASLAEGELFFKTDTEVWYSGPTGGGAPVIVNAVPSGVNTIGTLRLTVGTDDLFISFRALDGTLTNGTLTEESAGVYDIGVLLSLPSLGGVLASELGGPVFLVSVNPDSFNKVYFYNASGSLVDPTGASAEITFLCRRSLQ
jgi:hypothetical protein